MCFGWEQWDNGLGAACSHTKYRYAKVNNNKIKVCKAVMAFVLDDSKVGVQIYDKIVCVLITG